MTELPFGLMLEIVVAVLLVVTVCYCFVLNRRLKRFRFAQNDLREVIRDLTIATQSAENAIAGLKVTADDAERQLGDKLHTAKLLTRNLALFVEKSRAGKPSEKVKTEKTDWRKAG